MPTPVVMLQATDDPVSVARLIERGWSRAMVDSILGKADETRRNPHYRSGPPMRLYDPERVAAAERSDLFVQRQAKAREHGRRAAAVAQSKYNALIRQIDSLHIAVPKYDDEDVVDRAVDHYRHLWAERGRDDKVAGDDAAFLARIAVNYLRHACSRYEAEFAKVHGKVGADDARAIIRQRVYTAIADAYPQYRAECRRQRKERNQ